MVEFIQISGDIEEIKGSINYSATALFKNESGFDELKREYFNQFLCDFKKSAKRIGTDSKIVNTLVDAANKDKRSIEGDEEKEYVRHGVLLDSLSSNDAFEEKEDTISSSDYNKDICYVKHGVILEDYSNSDDTEESNSDSDDTEESNHSDFDDTEESNSDSDDTEESNHSDSDDTEESNSDSDDQAFDFDKPLFPPEEKEYVPHGVILEDYKEEVSLGGGYSEEDEVEKDSNDDSDESNYSEEDGDYSAFFDSNDDSKNNEDFKNESNSTEIPNHSYTEHVRRDKHNGSSEKPVVSKSEDKVITKSEDSDVPVFYKSVRDFVKKNSGCSAADIKKYFSVKEINKALMASKIVEKRNKFYVV